MMNATDVLEPVLVVVTMVLPALALALRLSLRPLVDAAVRLGVGRDARMERLEAEVAALHGELQRRSLPTAEH
ncbi:MAG TPA: hypothetical protein VGB96_00465 [Archangium sp.]